MWEGLKILSCNLGAKKFTAVSYIANILKLDFSFQNLEFKTHHILQIQGLMQKISNKSQNIIKMDFLHRYSVEKGLLNLAVI